MNFITNYLTYMQRSETPEIIHKWCALGCLAGAAEKRLWVDRGLFKIYLNLYLVLAAPPGVCAKTTTLSVVAKLLTEAGMNVLEDSITKEEIIREMVQLEKGFDSPAGVFYHSSVTFIASELNLLLASGYDMVKFLVSIWDKDSTFSYKTKTSGVYEVRNPYFNMLGAVVPEWFGENVISDINSTGFLARLLIIYADKRRMREPNPKLSDEAKRAKDECLNHLFWMSNLFGEIVLSSEAEEYYGKWYMEQTDDTKLDSRIQSYLERKAKTHVLKVAALLSLADKRLVVEKCDIVEAIRLLDAIEPGMKSMIMMSSNNKLMSYIMKIADILREVGELRYYDLFMILYSDLNKEQFREVLQVVLDLGIAKLESKANDKFLVYNG